MFCSRISFWRSLSVFPKSSSSIRSRSLDWLGSMPRRKQMTSEISFVTILQNDDPFTHWCLTKPLALHHHMDWSERGFMIDLCHLIAVCILMCMHTCHLLLNKTRFYIKRQTNCFSLLQQISKGVVLQVYQMMHSTMDWLPHNIHMRQNIHTNTLTYKRTLETCIA